MSYRYSSGMEQTKYTYTGQYSYASDFGLHFYREASRATKWRVDNARWYDSSLGRFAQADTILPSGVQGWDRYAYVNNSPIMYTDPSGNIPIPLILLIIAIPFVLAGDSQQINSDVATIQEINANSDNAVEDLANLFISDSISGEKPEKRFESILDGTRNGTALYFSEEFGDNGFKQEFIDPNDGSSNQVGHFLSAAAIAYHSSGTPLKSVGLSFIIGHELYPDPNGKDYGGFLIQGFYGANRSYHDMFLTGEESNLNLIMQSGVNGKGNSIENLRLSYKGWIFGESLRDGKFTNRQGVADWIVENLAQ